MKDSTMRTLNRIASDILANWPTINPYAAEYVRAMRTLRYPEDLYLFETGRDIVQYFLANAGGWRGEQARAIKAELLRAIK